MTPPNSSATPDSTKPTKEVEAVIFLDFDGVLHDVVGRNELFVHLPRFRALISKYPGAGVVVSSTWRLCYSEKELAKMLELGDQFLGVTPPSIVSRQAAIDTWLRANPGVRYKAIDDDRSSFHDLGQTHLIGTDPLVGLQDEDFEALEVFLKGHHRWNLHWPGNHCLDCGQDDTSVDALIECPICTEATRSSCEDCKGTGCGVDPNFKFPPCPGGC